MNYSKNIIFTDCFNTLIGRTKTPNDVLLDWGVLMNKIYPKIQPIDYFKMFKKEWENIFQRDIVQIENSEFLTDINEIFTKIFTDINKYNLLENIDETTFINEALQQYIKAEHASHFIKKKTLKYLIKNKNNYSKIYLVSDFYCSSEIIKQWLEMLGINVSQLIDKIYVSCEYKKSKVTGSLYNFILQENNLNHKQVTMIGDNLISDVKMARRAGLHAKWIAFPQIKKDNKTIRHTKQKLIIPNYYKELFEDNSNVSGFYTNYAFPLYAFIKRLYEQCNSKQIKNIFFLAREGKFLKQLFDIYCEYHNYNIKTHYFVVSRASVIVTTQKPFNEAFIGLINKPFLRTKNFLKTLHLSNQQVNEVCNNLKINPNKLHLILKNSKDYKKIINSKIFNDIFKNIQTKQRSAYTKYLNSFNVDIKNEGFYIVDSGWQGNMQRYIKNYFSTPQNVEGFYLGTGYKKCVQDKVFGLLFSTKLKKLNWQNKIFSYRRLNYEEILRTSSPTCIEYDDLGNPILAEPSNETKAYGILIKPMQNKILEKFKKIMEYDNNYYSNIYSICAYMNYQMIRKSNKIDRKFFNDVQDTFYDNFGYIGFQYKKVNKNIRLLNFRIRDFIYTIKYKNLINKKRKFWT